MKLAPSLLLLALSLGSFACGSSSSTEESGELELSPCCSSAMELVATMPECCQDGIKIAGQHTGCCEEGLQDATADADRPECCSKTRVILDEFKACCREVVMTGEAGACCETMPAALKGES